MIHIGFLGGSFDPIHNGHIHLALSLMEICGLDRILFCPTAQSPFKVTQPPLAAISHRLEMVKLAVCDISGFEVIDYEAIQNGPTYTIDTIRYLYQKFSSSNVQLHLILGEDSAAGLPYWKEMEALMTLAPPLVGARPLEDPCIASSLENTKKYKIPLLEISSTYIRERLKNKLYCKHLVPGNVLDYIYQHKLY